MERSQIHQLLSMLGAERVLDHDEWVSSSCVFAPWTHKKGTDSRPSFGISLGEHSSYNCFACGQKGKIRNLPTALWMLTGENPLELRKFIQQCEVIGGGYQYARMGLERSSEPAPEVISLNEFQTRFQPVSMDYRGLSSSQLAKHSVRGDTELNRLVIPIMDARGRIVGVKGRALNPETLKYLLYVDIGRKDPKTYGIWYGMHWQQTDKPLVLVEGEFDAMCLKEYSPDANVWAVMGVGITRRQIQAVQAVNKKIVFFFDDDEAGHRLKAMLSLRLKGKDLYEVTNYHGCKDPGDAYQRNLLKIISESVRRGDGA